MKYQVFEPEIQIAFLRRELDQVREELRNIQLIKGDKGDQGEPGEPGEKGEPGDTPEVDVEEIVGRLEESLNLTETLDLMTEAIVKLSAQVQSLSTSK